RGSEPPEDEGLCWQPVNRENAVTVINSAANTSFLFDGTTTFESMIRFFAFISEPPFSYRSQ
ncbi:MAG: hypothetical protein K0R19_1876, partial [Bacillota bacterium]|nr:hypothetical protein [Bacillota bacterium]